MATKKKKETSAAEVQQGDNQEQPVAATAMETGAEQGEQQEIPQTVEEASETCKPSDAETKTSDEGANGPVEKSACPKMENLSVLADRHRIPA